MQHRMAGNGADGGAVQNNAAARSGEGAGIIGGVGLSAKLYGGGGRIDVCLRARCYCTQQQKHCKTNTQAAFWNVDCRFREFH